MGYTVTRTASPDAALIDACARYAAGEDDGLMNGLSSMTAATPEGWRALAAAADHAAAMDHDGDAAALIFAMQRSLLGKRKRMRELPPRVGEPANGNEPVARLGLVPVTVDGSSGATNEVSTAEIVESWCEGTLDRCEPVLAGDAQSGLAVIIQARGAKAQGIDDEWKPSAAYLQGMASLISPDTGRFFVTA